MSHFQDLENGQNSIGVELPPGNGLLLTKFLAQYNSARRVALLEQKSSVGPPDNLQFIYLGVARLEKCEFTATLTYGTEMQKSFRCYFGTLNARDNKSITTPSVRSAIRRLFRF
jgi:hypothetical protein